MKIIRRDFISPVTSMNLWLIPFMSYLFQTFIGGTRSDREYIWFISISSAFIIWIAINWKIVKKTK